MLQMKKLKKTLAETLEAKNKVTETEKETSETKAKFDGQIKQISEAHVEINKEKAEMKVFKKEYKENLESFREETNALLEKNSEIQKEVESHLQKAVGVSLFKAFDERRKVVDKKANKWLMILLISIVAELVCIVVLSLTVNDIGAGFGIRTLLAFLIGWVAIYSGTQYKLERRAEEEYAFKSNISLSLKPFQDLLEEHKADGGDITSLEKRLDEVFDNPCARLFKGGIKSEDSSEDNITWLRKIVEKSLNS
jgi:ABC-type multidrug transport system fused ATPase/permease subunit